MSGTKTKSSNPPAARGRRRAAAAEPTAQPAPPADALKEPKGRSRGSLTPSEAPPTSANPALRAAEQILDVQKSLLHAGLRALRLEAGPTPGKGPWPLTSLEEVFDQRVAAALQRLGIPEQLERLQQQIDALKR